MALAAGLATATLVQVKAVRGGGTGGPSVVDVQPMVSQIDGDGTVVPHGIVNNIPVFRVQAGGTAFIIDPVVGDIGCCVFASRDISVVKVRRAPSQPGSARRFDMADGMYFGSFLGGGATSYVQATGAAINIVNPTAINMTAPVVTVTGELRVTQGVTAGYGGGSSVTLQQHTHPANGAPPTPGT